ncbi:MAG: DOMON domain-containing protein [Spirochaetaceae bacterium]|nr:DOMON domain-containing protein [Spirochaetaceae bacterium]
MKRKIFTLLFFMVFLVQFVFSVEQGRELSNGFKEIIKSDMTFQWKVESNSLRIILSAPTEGWIAVGFNPSKIMKDADFKLVYVDGSTVHMEDHFGDGLFGHKIDDSLGGSQDFEIIQGKEEMGKTTVEFTIPLNSNDEFDKILAEGDVVKVLLAYGTRDDLNRKHKTRTSVEIKL